MVYTLKNYKRNHCTIPYNLPRGSPKKKITQEALEYVTSPAFLKEHVLLNLKQRAAILKDRYGISLSGPHLGKLYRAERVSFRKPSFQYVTTTPVATKLLLQQQFSGHLV